MIGYRIVGCSARWDVVGVLLGSIYIGCMHGVGNDRGGG